MKRTASVETALPISVFGPLPGVLTLPGNTSRRRSGGSNGKCCADRKTSVIRKAATWWPCAMSCYVNIGAFSCASTNTACGVIHALSLRTDTPCTAIESDGDCITGCQLRQLEAVGAALEVLDETLSA